MQSDEYGEAPTRLRIFLVVSISFSPSFPPAAQSNVLCCIYSIKLGLLLEAPEEVGNGLL